MSDTSTALLQKAYSHIENDEREKAQEILAPLLEDHANNAHLWWVYTHAAQDASIGQAALERVLEIDPQYPGARELKADVLEAQSKDPDLIALGAVDLGAEAEASPLEVDDWEDLQPAIESTASGSSTRVRSILMAIALVVIAGGAIVLSGAVDLNELFAGARPSSPAPQVIIVVEPTSEPPTADDARAATVAPVAATEILTPLEDEASTEAGDGGPAATASQPEREAAPVETAEATATVGASATPSPTISPGSDREATFFGWIAEEIAEFPLDASRSGTLPTKLGNTLIVAACAIAGPELNARLEKVLSAAASLADRLPEAIEAVAAGLRDCDDGDASQRIIGVTRETLLDFANQEINAKEFQSAWEPLA